jgi:hypothetical protein
LLLDDDVATNVVVVVVVVVVAEFIMQQRKQWRSTNTRRSHVLQSTYRSVAHVVHVPLLQAAVPTVPVVLRHVVATFLSSRVCQ